MVHVTFKLPGGKKVDVADTPTDTQVLTFNSGKDEWDSQAGGAGESNTSSNSGAGDGWAQAKSGVDLPFKSLITSSPIATTSNANDLTITIDNISFTLLADGTDGELITWDSSGVPAAVAVGTVGQVLTSGGVGVAPTFQAAAGGGLTFARVVKTSDQSVTSSTTLVNDTQLVAALNANKTYGFVLYAWYDGNSTGDIKFTFTVPADATGGYVRATTISDDIVDFATVTAVGIGSADGIAEIAPIAGKVIVAGTSGNLQFRFAQNTSNATPTSIDAGSTLIVWEEA